MHYAGIPVFRRDLLRVSLTFFALSWVLLACEGEVGEGRGTLPAGTSSDSGDLPTTVEGHPVAPEAGAPPAVGSPPLEMEDPVPTTTLRIEPIGGTFEETLSVELSADHDAAAIHYTLDGTLPDRSSPKYAEPIVLESSAVLRAFVASEALGMGPISAAAFTQISSELGAFDSELPLILIQSATPAPTVKRIERDPVGVQVFRIDSEAGRSRLIDAPQLTARAGIKVRGSSSQNFDKKPYSLEYWSGELDDDADKPMLDLPNGSDWVLTSPYKFDRAFLRNALAYELSNRVGRYAPRTRFVELFFSDNGQQATMDDYQGIYLVTEKIKRDGSRLNLPALDPSMATLPEISGGYIFKLDRLGEGEVGFLAGQAEGAFELRPLAFVYPKEQRISEAQATFLSGYVDQFALALSNSDFTHPVTNAHYSELIDVESFIDHHVLSVLAKNPDALRLSSYLHKERSGKLQAGPLWDFDRTMGAAADSRAAEPLGWNADGDGTAVFEYGWWGRLFDDPAFAAAYWERMGVLLDGPLSEASVLTAVEELSVQVAPAAARNYARWPEVAPRGGSHAAEVKLLKEWLSARVSWMRGCLALVDPERCPAR